LHELARRYQRGAGRDNVSVLRDLLGLAPGYATTFRDNDEIEDGADFAIPVAAGGVWIGAAKSERGCPQELVVRTFIENRDAT
jgi:hypothetical protein